MDKQKKSANNAVLAFYLAITVLSCSHFLQEAFAKNQIIIGNQVISDQADMVIGNGKISRENREIPKIREIESHGSFRLYISRDLRPSLVLEADQNILPLVQTQISEHKLTIRAEGNISTNHPINVYINLPEMESLSMFGSGRAELNDLNSRTSDIAISGSSRVKMHGKSRQLHLYIKGSGRFDGRMLDSEDVSITMRGSAKVFVLAKATIDAKIIGSGKLFVYGKPARRQTSVKGSGKIQFK